MKRVLYLSVMGVLMFAPAQAREDCQTIRASCSQMNTRCEDRCRTMPNFDRCMAATCSILISECKSSGVWNPRGGATCWKTNNRS